MFFPRVERDVAARGLRSVRLVPRMPYEEAITRLARADVGLGIFGTSAKSGRVVPHKVFQSMALGIPTVTRRSAAITEFFRDEEHLALVPPGDGPALARAIESLARDPDRREKMGASGRSAAPLFAMRMVRVRLPRDWLPAWRSNSTSIVIDSPFLTAPGSLTTRAVLLSSRKLKCKGVAPRVTPFT